MTYKYELPPLTTHLARLRRSIHRIAHVNAQPMDELLHHGRVMFSALSGCTLSNDHGHDTRPGMHVYQKRSLVVFSRWHISLPEKRHFMSRETLLHRD